ncbi:kinetochore-associated protein NSL1 homolog [Polymixia lowei]
MEPEDSKTLSDESSQDYRVLISTKKVVVEQIKEYTLVLKKVLEDQPNLDEQTKQLLLQELLANFEAAVQENVLVNGQPWDEAPDDNEDEATALENLLDDTIVETTRRRRRYPREILPHVVRSLKQERKLMSLYDQTVKPQVLVKDPGHENTMSTLSAAAPGMVKQAIQVIKSIDTLQKQAEGLCQVLNMKPSHTSLEIHKEVFGLNGQSDAQLPPSSKAIRSRQPIKRAVEETAARNCYMPPNKKTDCHADTDKPE